MYHKIISAFLIVIYIIPLQSCKETQDELFNKLKQEFADSIKISQANQFEYQYDLLTPQKSYFVGCKLRFLTIKRSGELTDTEDYIIFENDSINRIFTRKKIFEGSANGNLAGRNWNKIDSDTIYVADFEKLTKEIYANNKLVKTLNTKNFEQNYKFIHKIKKQTEATYKCKP